MKKIFISLIIALFGICGFAQNYEYYSHKSGKYTLETNAGGQVVQSKVVFDGFGSKQWTQTETAGQTVTMLALNGKSYLISPMFQELPAIDNNVNFLNLTPEVIERYKIKMVGLEKMNGYDCLVYTFIDKEYGIELNAKSWVWDGFPIKTEVYMMGQTIASSIISMELDIPVDASLFNLPE